MVINKPKSRVSILSNQKAQKPLKRSEALSLIKFWFILCIDFMEFVGYLAVDIKNFTKALSEFIN